MNGDSMAGDDYSMETIRSQIQYTQFKILLIGDSGVGKTCILLKYVDDTFRTNYITTVGIDYRIKTLEVDGQDVKLQIWDTAGQERFESMMKSFYRDAHGIMLVYDITNQRSFEDITIWLGNITVHAPFDVERLLVGNKSDAEAKRVIPHSIGQQIAEEQSIGFIETSAKANYNINEAFVMLVKQILKNMNDKVSHQDSLSNQEQDNENNCWC